MLQGKAREEFEKYFNEKCYDATFDFNDFMSDYLSVFRNALIIEWFSTLKYKNQNFWLYVFDFYYEQIIDTMTFSDINIQAITKANEIFNQLIK